MPFWGGATLKECIPHWRIVDDFDENRIDCAAYTLRLGREIYVTPDYQVSRLYRHTKRTLGDGESFTIPPGQFAFLLTEEYVRMPPHVLGFISLRTRYKWRGLINVSGFHVDPGFNGHLIYAVYNAGPSYIHLERGAQMFLIWFAELDKSDHAFTRQEPPITGIDPLLINPVGSQILNLQSVSDRIKELEQAWFHMKIYGGVILTFIAVIGVAFTVIRFGRDIWNTIKGWVT